MVEVRQADFEVSRFACKGQKRLSSDNEMISRIVSYRQIEYVKSISMQIEYFCYIKKLIRLALRIWHILSANYTHVFLYIYYIFIKYLLYIYYIIAYVYYKFIIYLLYIYDLFTIYLLYIYCIFTISIFII